MGKSSSYINPVELRLSRWLLAIGAVLYTSWWFVVEALLGPSYNPLLGRLGVVSCFLIVLGLSYVNRHVAARLALGYQVCAWLLTAHYCYLLHHNSSHLDWVVGLYITVAAVNACIHSRVGLVAYSVWVATLCGALAIWDPELRQSIFLPGLLTILALFNIALRNQLALVERLATGARQLDSLFNATFEGICLHDNGRILDANRSFCELFGYTHQEILRRNVRELVSEDVRDSVMGRIARMDHEPYETIGVHKSGKRFVIEVAGKPHQYNGKTVRLAAVRDINESKIAHEAVRVRDEFLSVASHELKTPITSFKLQTQTYQRLLERNDPKATTPERIAKFVDSSGSHLTRLERLVDDMLDISRIRSGKLIIERSQTDLKPLVEQTVERFVPLFESAGSPVTIEAPQSVLGHWDANRLEQVLANLITNAIKYGSGKPIAIRLARDEGGDAKIQVADHGMGIAREHQQKIFERFERAVTAQHISGLGLGLYIAHSIVEQHGGSIHVQSEPGRGSTFTVSLPG